MITATKSRLRPWRWGLAFVVGAALQGCPVYDDYCNSRSDCAPGFECNRYTGDCELVWTEPGKSCAAPTDCGPGETCGQSGACLPGSCVFHGCVSGYSCTVVDGVHTCAAPLVADGGGPGATDGGAPDGGSPDASAPDSTVDGGLPDAALTDAASGAPDAL